MREKQQKDLPKINLTKPTFKPVEPAVNMEVLRKHHKDEEKWTEEETQALLRGIEKYGIRNWSMILERYDNVFQGKRRVVDLVSKFKLLNKESSFYKTAARDWIVLDEVGEPEIDELGEIIIVHQKFPYDAAKNFAKKKVASGMKKFVIRIRETQNIDNLHVYSVDVDTHNKMKLIKLKKKEK